MLEAYEQAIAGGPRYDVDYRVRLPDGVVRYVHSEADVTRDADGRPLRMFGLRRVADEQAALLRVATLVAQGVAPERLLAAVAEQAGKVLTSAEMSIIGRYTADHAIEFVGGWGRTSEPGWVGQRASLGGLNISTLVYETAERDRRRAVRFDEHRQDAPAPHLRQARRSRSR